MMVLLGGSRGVFAYRVFWEGVRGGGFWRTYGAVKLDGWMVGWSWKVEVGGGSGGMGLEGCQRLVQFMQLLWCGLRVIRVTPMALEEDGHENRFWGRDAERHEDGCALLRVKAVIRPRRLGNAERRTEGRRCLIVHKVVLELFCSAEEESGFFGFVLEEGLLEDG